MDFIQSYRFVLVLDRMILMLQDGYLLKKQGFKNMSYAPILTEGDYDLKLEGITVDNIDVDMSNIRRLNASDPIDVVVDIGNPSTWLQEPLHSRFMNTFIAAMKKNTMLSPSSYYTTSVHTCYSVGVDVDIMSIQIPNVIFHLQNDVHLHLGIENLFFFWIENNQRVLCSNFWKKENDFKYLHLLGSSMLQNFYVEIDNNRRQIGFTRSDCGCL
ncbi:hypothetical protein KC19_1G083800 [Ceratodon purpureus]|uniref:Peptidase A1 domain-containing protein n=1 Tax=Ceratodon purpureus TaxID=3225 RepID=A0A8T0J629_CERPU|nr:hypothetical protein KC19_1G083800 [Ceratodon purpureus]